MLSSIVIEIEDDSFKCYRTSRRNRLRSIGRHSLSSIRMGMGLLITRN